jgi:alpha-L-fucosidase
MLELHKATRVDTVILQEDIRGGERVRAYTLEGRSDGKWKSLGQGTAVGNKRIQPVWPATVDAVRLTVTQHVGTPRIARMAVFDTGVAPPTDWNATAQMWAPNTVGRWRDGAFSLDLTKHIDAAKQYRLRFVPSVGIVKALSGVVLKLHGVPQPDLLKTVKGRPNELILDITEVSDSVTIEGKVEDAASGEVLLQKL